MKRCPLELSEVSTPPVAFGLVGRWWLFLYSLALIAVTLPVVAVEPTRDKLIAVYLFRLAEQIQWPNQARIDLYHFHLVGNDRGIARQLQEVARSERLNGRSITVSDSTDQDIPDGAHLIYLAHEHADRFAELVAAIGTRPVLLISDGVGNRRVTMIDLHQDETNRIRFLINKANILNQGLGVHPDIILLGGSEVDVAELYREGQQALATLEGRLATLQSGIAQAASERTTLLESLAAQKDELKQLMAKLSSARNEVAKLQRDHDSQSRAITQKNKELETVARDAKRQRQQLERQQQQLREQQRQIEVGEARYSSLVEQVRLQEANLENQAIALRLREERLHEQRREIEKRAAVLSQQAGLMIEQENTIIEQEARLKEIGREMADQRQVLLLVVTVGFLVMLLALTLWISNRQKRRINHVLMSQKGQLERVAEELQLAKLATEEANRELHEKEEFSRLLLESIAEGIIGVDIEGRTTFINPTAARLLDYQPGELIGLPLYDRIYPPMPVGSEDLRKKSCLVMRSIHENRTMRVDDENFCRRDGSCFPVTYSSTPIPRGDEIIGAVIAFTDITELRRIEDELRHMSITDQLTGIFNRRRLDELMLMEDERSLRYGTTFSVIMVDVDQFKAVNDNHGHLVGDEVLKAMASLLRERIRTTDILGRWGGEEFLVICPQTGLDNAMHLAEQLRQSVDGMIFPTVGRMTASFGVACYRTGECGEDVVRRADELLYRAKSEGRNRVIAQE